MPEIVTPEKYDTTFRKALSEAVRQIWKMPRVQIPGIGLPAVLVNKKKFRPDHDSYATVVDHEALWVVVNRRTATAQPTEERVAGQIQTISYEALGISVLSMAKQPPVLAVGRPQHLTSFLDKNQLFEWQDQFRSIRAEDNPFSLKELIEEYIKHGPSEVFRTVFLPTQRKTATKT